MVQLLLSRALLSADKLFPALTVFNLFRLVCYEQVVCHDHTQVGIVGLLSDLSEP